MIVRLLLIVAWAMTTAGLIYLAAAVLLVRRFGARALELSSNPATSGITILKPLHGDEPALFDNLSSFCEQNYPGPVQIVFGVHDATDEAVSIVERLRRAYADKDIELVIDGTMHGRNRKVSNLANMEPRIRNDVVVIADSDIRVEADYLLRLMAALHEPGVNGVTCLYYGVPATGLWASLSALAINAHFLPNVVTGVALRLAHPCFGSTIALRHEMLTRIGGFGAFADQVADDYAIGAALRMLGGRISIPPFAIAHYCSHMSAREMWRQELRWARTIRSIDPGGYLGSAVTHVLPWSLITMLAAGAAAGGHIFAPLVAAVVAIIGRAILLRQVQRAFGLKVQPYWLIPVRDLLSFAIFVWSFFGHDVWWKKYRYQMQSEIQRKSK